MDTILLQKNQTATVDMLYGGKVPAFILKTARFLCLM